MAELAAKLQIKPKHTVLVVNAPADPRRLLGPLPRGAQVITAPAAGADAVIFFVKDSSELRTHAGAAVQAASGDKILWVAYPKGTSGVKSDLNRDRFAGLLKEYGVQPVSQVAVDSIWSALRLRPLTAAGR